MKIFDGKFRMVLAFCVEVPRQNISLARRLPPVPRPKGGTLHEGIIEFGGVSARDCTPHHGHVPVVEG